ncbi:phage protease [Yersinia kristensenii]|uniref:phage protease n=1 Tax=Yersinia kristensenii TaxID=28152 RepID=UPI0028535DFB|nr:phage protease [Yersinia kristensenii]MDR4896019.1 phage protease [Yersinia kristensenii]MDX6734708.1 phage protease [Yersinia kristensenii]
MKTLFAALAIEITKATHGTIQLFPAGEFRAVDGRPEECDHWVMNAEIAQRLIDAANAKLTPYVIDYEHQTLRAIKNGQPAPAAGWFKKLEWRGNDGLFAVDVEWTDAAAEMILAGEYRFISPVFNYSKSGHVLQILHAALTNTPALDDMDEVMLAAASVLAINSTSEGNAGMDELLEQLRWMLNLPLSTTQEEVMAELMKLIKRLSNDEGTAAASVNLLQILDQHDTQIAALTAQVTTPDPVKWVSVDVMHQAVSEAVTQAQANIAALASQQCDGLITAALSDGRLLPAQKAWAESLAKANPDSLKSFLDKAPKIAALTQTQTGGTPPAGSPPAAREEDDGEVDMAICSLLGTDPKQIAEFIKGEKK